MISETDARRSVAMTSAPCQPLDAGDDGGVALEIDAGAKTCRAPEYA